MTKKLLLANLNISAGTDTRHEIDEDTVTQYGEDMHKKAKFPPLIVFDAGKEDGLILADGFHRFYGAERQGIKNFDCDVRKGTREDAIKYALGCNTTHGLRRTNADKRHAVEIALKEFPQLSDRSLADICAVGHPLVGEVRAKLQPPQVEDSSTSNEESPAKAPNIPPPPQKRTGKDGKKYTAPAPRPRSEAPPAPPAPARTMDATGLEVPEEIVPYWDSSITEAKRLLNLVSEVRSRIKKAQDTREPMFREIDHTDSIAKLDQVYEDLKRAQPYAVCPDCNGIDTKACTTCKGKAFVSAFYWKHSVPEEKKKISGRA